MAKQQRWGNNERQDDSGSGREKILEAARYCYASAGIANTTLDDIATQAKITRRTVYRYFSSKKAIVQACVDEQAMGFLRQMQDELPDPALSFAEQLQVYIVYLIQYGQLASGHQLLLGTDNLDSSREYYFSSGESYAVLRQLIEKPLLIAQENGEACPDLKFEDLMAWLGRVIFSYIEMPLADELLKRQIGQFVIPALMPSGGTPRGGK